MEVEHMDAKRASNAALLNAIGVIISHFVLGLLGLIVGILAIFSGIYGLKVIKKEEAASGKWKCISAIIIGTLGIILGFTSLPKYIFAYSEASCDILYPTTPSLDLKTSLDSISENNKCKSKVKMGKTLFTFYKKPGIKDPNCEAETGRMKDVCYFKKALDTKNPEYCYNFAGPDLCIHEVAVVLKDKSLCQHTTYQSICEEDVDSCINNPEQKECKIPPYRSCDTSFNKGECIRKYGLTSE
jgi:hypothetical protein